MTRMEEYLRKADAFQNVNDVSILQVDEYKRDCDTKTFQLVLSVSGMLGGKPLKRFPEPGWLEKALKKVWPQVLEEMKQVGQLDVLTTKGEAAKEAADFLGTIGH